jgi:hypothetical protein
MSAVPSATPGDRRPPELGGREIDERFPRSQRLRVAALELHDALACPTGEVGIARVARGRLPIGRREVGPRAEQRLGISPGRPTRPLDQQLDQHPELRAPIADVVLSDHVVTLERERARERVADDGAPQMSDVHLLRDVRPRIVDDHGVPPRSGRDAESGVVGRGLADQPSEVAVVEADVHEAGARDLRPGGDAGEVDRRDDRVGHLARLAAEAFCEAHRDVRLEVAEARILRLADERIGGGVLGAERAPDRVTNPTPDRVFEPRHGGAWSGRGGAASSARLRSAFWGGAQTPRRVPCLPLKGPR